MIKILSIFYTRTFLSAFWKEWFLPFKKLKTLKKIFKNYLNGLKAVTVASPCCFSCSMHCVGHNVCNVGHTKHHVCSIMPCQPNHTVSGTLGGPWGERGEIKEDLHPSLGEKLYIKKFYGLELLKNRNW